MKTSKFWSIIMMLVLMSCTGITFSSCGNTDDDDDSSNDSSISISNLIGNWASDTDDYQEILYIMSDGRIGYAYDNLGDADWTYVDAGGTYTVSGNVITAKYTTVEVGGYKTKNVMGFSNNTSKTVKYTIKNSTSKSMTVTNDATGKTTKFEKY